MKRSKQERGKPAAEGAGLTASRRDFLKLSTTGVACLARPPALEHYPAKRRFRELSMS